MNPLRNQKLLHWLRRWAGVLSRITGSASRNYVTGGVRPAPGQRDDVILRQPSLHLLRAVGAAMAECGLDRQPLLGREVIHRRLRHLCSTLLMVVRNALRIISLPLANAS